MQRVIDAKEQRVERPRREARRRPSGSGKKRCHTVSSRLAMQRHGTIGAASVSVPGGAWHDLMLLRHRGQLDRLDAAADEGAMLVWGHVGVRKDRPGRPRFVPHRSWRGRPLSDERWRWSSTAGFEPPH